MKNLTLSLLGLVFIYLPASVNGKQCFSQKLNPPYPCCTGNQAVVYTVLNGKWGIENGDWCGISDPESCFSVALGYPCCEGDNVVLTDSSGDWGIENGNWCGIGGDSEEDDPDTCFAAAYGYPCCKSCKIKYTDESGSWGKENKQWCGIKDICHKRNNDQDDLDLDFKFLRLENNKKNMVYSPLSIKYGLNMLQEGAANSTYAEINKVIGNTALTKYESMGQYLSLANGLFINSTYYEFIKPQYIDTIYDKYRGEIFEDDFESAININQWIKDKTLGVIKDMISDQQVQNPDTVMFIINALAMDMRWENEFDYDSTYGRDFTLENGNVIKATTMYSGEKYYYVSYYTDDDISVITMDLQKYYGKQFEFMAIMPKNENLSDYVNKVTKEQIDEIDEKLLSPSDRPVVVYIPKFKINYDLDFKEDLKKLGIKEAFSTNADFSNMAYGLEKEGNPYERLYVSEALHKSNIDFTELGVKAAAVTVFIMGGLNGSSNQPYVEKPTPIVIHIDKPFMFIVRDKSTKDIWFTGTVYKPNLWEDDKSEYEPQTYTYNSH